MTVSGGSEAVDVLMSGTSELFEAIIAIAAQGYEEVQITVDIEGCSLSVTDGHSAETAASIVRTVLRIDPGAVIV
jgi:hypothetical protein